MSNEIKHHLPPEILMGYAAGTLPEAFNLIVAAHVSMCDSCRAEVESYNSVGGALLDADVTNSVAMEADSFEATMARIAGAPELVPAAKPSAKGVFPMPLQDYVGGDLETVKWRPIGMGVKQSILKTSGTASARLLFIPAGTAVPDHGHNGMELTMVLKGAFMDEDDYFGPGDVETADADLEHTPVADIGEDCICLAVTDAPLKFRSWLPRLAQPFLRI